MIDTDRELTRTLTSLGVPSFRGPSTPLSSSSPLPLSSINHGGDPNEIDIELVDSKYSTFISNAASPSMIEVKEVSEASAASASAVSVSGVTIEPVPPVHFIDFGMGPLLQHYLVQTYFASGVTVNATSRLMSTEEVLLELVAYLDHCSHLFPHTPAHRDSHRDFYAHMHSHSHLSHSHSHSVHGAAAATVTGAGFSVDAFERHLQQRWAVSSLAEVGVWLRREGEGRRGGGEGEGEGSSMCLGYGLLQEVAMAGQVLQARQKCECLQVRVAALKAQARRGEEEEASLLRENKNNRKRRRRRAKEMENEEEGEEEGEGEEGDFDEDYEMKPVVDDEGMGGGKTRGKKGKKELTEKVVMIDESKTGVVMGTLKTKVEEGKIEDKIEGEVEDKVEGEVEGKVVVATETVAVAVKEENTDTDTYRDADTVTFAEVRDKWRHAVTGLLDKVSVRGGSVDRGRGRAGDNTGVDGVDGIGVDVDAANCDLHAIKEDLMSPLTSTPTPLALSQSSSSILRDLLVALSESLLFSSPFSFSSLYSSSSVSSSSLFISAVTAFVAQYFASVSSSSQARDTGGGDVKDVVECLVQLLTLLVNNTTATTATTATTSLVSALASSASASASGHCSVPTLLSNSDSSSSSSSSSTVTVTPLSPAVAAGGAFTFTPTPSDFEISRPAFSTTPLCFFPSPSFSSSVSSVVSSSSSLVCQSNRPPPPLTPPPLPPPPTSLIPSPLPPLLPPLLSLPRSLPLLQRFPFENTPFECSSLLHIPSCLLLPLSPFLSHPATLTLTQTQAHTETQKQQQQRQREKRESTGRRGEQWVYQYLLAANPTAHVTWMNETSESRASYDITISAAVPLASNTSSSSSSSSSTSACASRSRPGDRRVTAYVEVKTSLYRDNNVFQLSLWEWEFATKLPRVQYCVVRVFGAGDPATASLVIIPDLLRFVTEQQVKLCLAI